MVTIIDNNAQTFRFLGVYANILSSKNKANSKYLYPPSSLSAMEVDRLHIGDCEGYDAKDLREPRLNNHTGSDLETGLKYNVKTIEFDICWLDFWRKQR